MSEVRRDLRNADLERAILANPEDVESYLVYADWLIENGDPRGELVTTQIAAENGSSIDRRNAITVFAKYRDYFFGGLAERVAAAALDWKCGFIHHARLSNQYIVFQEGARTKTPLANIASTLFAHPSARFLVKVTIGDTDQQPGWSRIATADVSAVLERLAAAPPTLRELVLAEPVARYRLDTACPYLTTLTDLDATGRLGLESLVLPNLRRAIFRAVAMGSVEVRAIGTAVVPKLQSLTIELGETSQGPPARMLDFEGLLRRDDLPLDHLAISGCKFGNQLLERLAESAILPKITELQITDGSFDDRGARVLSRYGRAFRHLELFDVTGNQKLTDNGVRILKSFAPQVLA